MALSVIVFATVYLWLIVASGHRAKAIWIGVLALFLLPQLGGEPPILSFGDLFELDEAGRWASINWNVIGIFVGTLFVAEAFIYSRVPVLLADILIDRSPNVGWAILSTCIFASAISAVAENVATVLIVAPVAFALADKLRVSPAPFIVGIAISSNLQGTATLIGDPPSMILASELGMDFNDFFWYTGPEGASFPGIFWAVQVGGIAGFAVLWLMFRKHREPVVALEKEEPLSWFPTVLMGVMIAGLALASLVDEPFIWFGGTLCMVLGLLAMYWFIRADRRDAVRCLRDYDFSTTFFLMGIFMLVYALEKTGAIEGAASWAGGIVGDNLLGAFVLIVLFSVVFSAFVDNVPYLAAMLPLIARLSEGMGVNVYQQPILAFGLLMGACLGGNVTPVGASANIVAYGMLNEDENVFPFVEFVKIGLPFTVAAVAAGATFLWLIY